MKNSLSAAVLSNASSLIQLKERSAEQEAEHYRLLDAVAPPAWYYPELPMFDASDLYDTDLYTAAQIKQTTELLHSRYVKWCYRAELAEQGSVEALRLHKQKDQQRREEERVEWCAKRGPATALAGLAGALVRLVYVGLLVLGLLAAGHVLAGHRL